MVAALIVTLLGAVSALASRGVPATTRDSGRIAFHATNLQGQGSYREIDLPSRRETPITDRLVDVARGGLTADGRSAYMPCVPEALDTSSERVANSAICLVDLVSGVRQLVVDVGTPVLHPTPSPDGRSIMFVSGADGDRGPKIIGSDGSGLASLCSGFCPLFRSFDIAWSPDATRVAFVATTPGSAGHFPEIYVATVGGSDYTQLTASSGAESDPAWSPDGKRLAFASSRGGDTELWVMNADGSGQVQFTDRPGSDIEPTWSPDGSRLAYTRHVEGSWDVAVIPVGGGEPMALATSRADETAPWWLP